MSHARLPRPCTRAHAHTFHTHESRKHVCPICHLPASRAPAQGRTPTHSTLTSLGNMCVPYVTCPTPACLHKDARPHIPHSRVCVERDLLLYAVLVHLFGLAFQCQPQVVLQLCQLIVHLLLMQHNGRSSRARVETSSLNTGWVAGDGWMCGTGGSDPGCRGAEHSVQTFTSLQAGKPQDRCGAGGREQARGYAICAP
eukprot:364197-Chlamydomonas_euryale.AAC.32